VLGTRFTRGQFLSGAGKLAVAGAGLGLGRSLIRGGARPDVFRPRATSKTLQISVVEQAFGPFFTENFNNPLNKYLATHSASAKRATTTASVMGWKDAFGNEDNVITTGINLFNEYVANNSAVLILSTGDEMTAWQHTVKQAVGQGVVFINHSTQGVAGATQNTLFSHKGAGVGVGQAAVVWAHKNHITQPVVALIGNLTDSQGSKRTTWAWKTIKAAFPSAQLVGSVQGIDVDTGAKGAANLLAAHPNINMMIVFNTLAGTGAFTSATHAGKTDRNSFFLGMTDFEGQTLSQIAAANTIVQANWGTYFPASMILMARDAINQVQFGVKMKPTRLLLGEAIVTPAQATSFNKVVFDPLNPANAYVYTKYFEYLSTPVGTAQVPPGQ
jgi:ABC-type sugar transport system substrate-binding protein